MGEEAASVAPQASSCPGSEAQSLQSTPGAGVVGEGRELGLSERVPSSDSFPSHNCLISSFFLALGG